MTTSTVPDSGASTPLATVHQFTAHRLSGRAYTLGALCRAANSVAEDDNISDANWLIELGSELAHDLGSQLEALAAKLTAQGASA
ncbi:MAG: hypothetical protein V4750_14770 [Pseudomonadota bacterium]